MSSSESESEPAKDLPVTKSRTKRGLSELGNMPPLEEITSRDVLYSGSGRQPLDWHQLSTKISAKASTNSCRTTQISKVSGSKKDIKDFPCRSVTKRPASISEDLCNVSKEDNEVVEVKDPTPPPSPSKKWTKPKAKRMKKGVKSAITKLQKIQSFILVDSEDDGDDCVEVSPIKPVKIQDICVKIRCPSGIRKYSMKQTDSFSRVFKEIAQIECVSEENLVMFLNDKTVHSYDSPKSLGISIADILECHIRLAPSGHLIQQMALDVSDDPSIITLNLQMTDSKSRISLSIRKNEPMEKLMQQFCSVTGTKYGSVQFQFDGESIDLSESAESLDLETDYCIDVLPILDYSNSRRPLK